MPFRHEIDIRRLIRLLRTELFRFQEYISPSVQRFKHYFVWFCDVWGSKALWTMLKDTAILRPALWAPKYLGGRIVFRLRFRLKTFVFWRKKYEAKSFFG